MVDAIARVEPQKYTPSIINVKCLKFFTTFFTIWWLVNRAEDVLRQSLILTNLLSSSVFCPPPFLLSTQQVEPIWMVMSTRHLFFKFFLFVFHFSKKKFTENCYPRPSTWNPRPSTLDIKTDSKEAQRL